LWQYCGGIICDWFWTERIGIYVRCQKLDFASQHYLLVEGVYIIKSVCVYIYVIFLKYLRFCYASITSLHSPIYIFICKYQNINMNIRMKINKYKQINYIYIYIILVCRTVCRPRSSYTHVCVCECSNIDKAIYKHLLNGVHFFGAQCPPKGSGK